jgi:hypothetical protein
MSATIELFEQFKEHLTVRSDHAAGRILGVKPQTISNWRTRGSQAEPKLIETMCHKMDMDPTPWLLRAQAEQAHDPANVMVWKRMASRLGVALSAIALFLGRGNDAVAQTVMDASGMNAYAVSAMETIGQIAALLPLGA